MNAVRASRHLGRAFFQRRLRELRLPGTAGVGVLAACLAFYVSALQPAEHRLEELRAQVRAQERLGADARARGAGPASAAERLARFYEGFPPESELLAGVEEIFAAAGTRRLTLERGEYNALRNSLGRLTRFQLTLPLRGEYPRIREFLADVLAALPHAALEQVQFERGKIADATVEARVRLVLYLERAS
jgi:hypothetical protein